MLLDLGAHRQARRARRDDEPGLPAGAELGVDGGDDHVHVGDPAVGGPGLLAVEDPLVGRLVVAGARPQRGHVGAGVGLGDAERADLRLVDGAVALRHPLAELLARAGGEDRGDGERRAHDRHPDPGVAPEQLLVDDRQQQAGLVGVELRQRLEAVEADLRRLLDQRPGRLLALVPLRRGGADDVLGESVDPVAHVALVLAELHRERASGELFGNGLHRMGTIMTYAPAEDRYDRMPYRRCGRSGIKLPAISLGLWNRFGDDTPHREPARDHPPRLRPRHHPHRPGQQLRPALRLGRDQLRPDPARGPAALPRRADHLVQGRLRHVARPVRRVGLAQVPAGEPRPEPGADGPGVRRHLLLAPLRPGHAAGGDDRRARHRRPVRASALYAGISSYSAERTAEAVADRELARHADR